MIEQMIERANADPVLARRGRFIDIAFGLAIGPERRVVRIDGGKVSEAAPDSAEPAFTLKAAAEAWADFARPVPPPGANDILALLEVGRLTIEGDALVLMRNLLFVKLLLEKARGTELRA